MNAQIPRAAFPANTSAAFTSDPSLRRARYFWSHFQYLGITIATYIEAGKKEVEENEEEELEEEKERKAEEPR